jgi:hypothetical protein
VALDRVSGAVASAPAIAATVSVLRTFINIVPFAGARGEASQPMWARCPSSGELGAPRRAISFRHDSRGTICRSDSCPTATGGCHRPQPRSHAVRRFDFVFALAGRYGPYETGLHFVICSHFDISVQ